MMINVWIKQNGSILGPLPLERIINAYRKGQLEPDAQISDNQKTWYPITKLDKIQIQSNKNQHADSISSPTLPTQVQESPQRKQTATPIVMGVLCLIIGMFLTIILISL